MVFISQKDFNKSLDKYLRHESQKTSFSGNKRLKIKKNEKVPEDLSETEVHVEEKTGFFERLFRKDTVQEEKNTEDVVNMDEHGNRVQVISDDEAMEETEHEFKKAEKESFCSKLKGIFGCCKKSSKNQDEVSLDEIEAGTTPLKANDKIKDDLKELAKITYRIMERLEESEIQDLKSSKDFVVYRQILERNGLLKK